MEIVARRDMEVVTRGYMEIATRRDMEIATRTDSAAAGDWRQTPHEDRARACQQPSDVKKTTKRKKNEKNMNKEKPIDVKNTTKKKKKRKKNMDMTKDASSEAAAQPSPANLAVHFAELTRRCEDGRTNGKRFDEFMQNAKKKLICDLTSTYKELYSYYNDPTKSMPSWLSSMPPAKFFLTDAMDRQLLSKTLQIQQGVRAFVEELHFICLDLDTLTGLGGQSVIFKLRLDVATVPTPASRKHVQNKLHTLGTVLQ